MGLGLQGVQGPRRGLLRAGQFDEGFVQDTLQSIANSVQPGLWTSVSKGKAKWSDPGIVKTLSIWKSLFTDGIMQSGALGYAQYPDANNAFLTGKFAMVQMGTWYMENVTQAGMKSAISAAGVANPKPFPDRGDPVPERGRAHQCHVRRRRLRPVRGDYVKEPRGGRHVRQVARDLNNWPAAHCQLAGGHPVAEWDHS